MRPPLFPYTLISVFSFLIFQAVLKFFELLFLLVFHLPDFFHGDQSFAFIVSQSLFNAGILIETVDHRIFVIPGFQGNDLKVGLSVRISEPIDFPAFSAALLP